jgi:outer membrane protein
MTPSWRAVVLFLAFAAVLGSAHAQGSGSIAVIDPQFLLWNSSAAKNARTQVERIRSDLQQQFKSRQDEMDKMYEALSNERAKLAPDAYQKRGQDLQQKASDYQREAQDRLVRLDGALNGVSQKIAAAMTDVVNEVMKEKSLSLVVPRSVVIGTPGVPDITQDVLARLNQKMPSISIEAPR